MPLMNLHKALKMKNQLAGEIRQITAILRTHNRHESDENGVPLISIEFDLAAQHRDLLEKIEDLIRLKSAITRANVELYPLLATIEEKKGLHAFYNGLEVGAGRTRHFELHDQKPKERHYKVFIDEGEKMKRTKALEEEIFDLQCRVDTYNYTVEVDIDTEAHHH